MKVLTRLQILFVLAFASCNNRSATYDTDWKGTRLTPFGCLVSGDWYYNTGNEEQVKDSVEIASFEYLPKQGMNSVFRLYEDYTVSSKSLGDKDWRFHGKWSVDFKDSSINIDFGANAGIKPIRGKILTFGSNDLSIMQILKNSSDSTNGLVDKKITIWYTHSPQS